MLLKEWVKKDPLQESTGGRKMQEFIHVYVAAKGYSCMLNTLLCRSDHKYSTNSGYPTFWNHIIDAIKFRNDNLDIPKITNAYVDPLYQDKEPI